jgi:hypothetical protein
MIGFSAGGGAKMRFLRLLVACGLVPALIGCASLQVRYDYNRGADFSKLKKYDWLQEQPDAKVQGLMVKRIENTVNTQLEAKGLQPASEHPDFFIRLEVSEKKVYGGSTGVGASVGIPVGGAGFLSLGSGTSTDRGKIEWRMVLDFLDTNDSSLLWQATATDTVNPKMSPEEQERLINRAVSEMLSHFPPPHKK